MNTYPLELKHKSNVDPNYKPKYKTVTIKPIITNSIIQSSSESLS